MTTFVLVHGAWSGGWVWQGAARELRRRGHEVFVPTMTGVGERVHLGRPEVDLSWHVQDLAGVFEYEDLRDVVLVGFSYGGLPAAGLAKRMPERVRRLVYFDAFVPVEGKSFLDLVPPMLAEVFVAQARMHGDGWRVPPLPLQPLGARAPEAASEEAILAMLAKRRPQPIGTFREPASAAPEIATTYVLCTGKPQPDAMALNAARAREAGASYAELPTGHFAMLTMPSATTALLDAL